jgi:iron(III) transport system ATP-binding protein
MATLELRAVSKRYGDVVALDRLSLAIGDGEMVVLLGPSGCGKTTALRLIAGLLTPDAGEILLDGEPISSAARLVPPERRGMAMVFQSYALWPHMTVFDNVAYGLRVRRARRAEILRRVSDALALVRLGGLDARYPGELSGGQQQRVALARAIVVEPEILLFDEPLSNLDAMLRDEMRFELRALQRKLRITSVYVTHEQREALVLADRVVVMRGGRLVQSGSPEAIVRRPADRFVASFLGTSNLLGGVVRGVDEARRCVRVHVAGRALEAALADGGPPPKTGTKAVVSVRPVDVRLTPAADGGAGVNALVGRVVERAFLGDLVEYQVALDDETVVTARCHPSVRWAAGDRVCAVFDAADATCLPDA